MYNIYGFSLTGMKHYFDLVNEPLFKDIILFQGGVVYNNEWEDGQEIPPIDKDTLVNYIMEYNNSLFPVRQIPEQFKANVNYFFKANYNNFRMMWIALNMNYNPIDNYDRHEYILDEYDSSTKRTDSTHYKDKNDLKYEGVETRTNTPSGKESVKTEFTGNDEVENKISADNTSSYDPHTQTITTHPTQTNTTEFTNNRKTEDKLEFTNRHDNNLFEHIYLDGNDLNEHLGNDTRKIWAHGNIGAEKTSSIIKAELEMRQFDFYEYVANLFSKKLLLEVY